MDYQTKLLAIVAAINILLSAFVASQEKSPVNILFALFTFFIGLWALGLGLFIYVQDFSLALLITNFFYLAPPLIVTIFLFFSVIFVGGKFKTKYYFNFIPFAVLLFLLLFYPNFLIEKVYPIDHGIFKDVLINKKHYIYYAIYVVGYIIISYSVLFRAFGTNAVYGKERQLRIIILGTLVSYILATFFNLLLPYLGNYQLISFGPLFTLVMVFSIAYAILKYQLFNIKLILVELAILLLNLFLFLNVFTSHLSTDLVLNAAVSVFVLLFSIVLVRGIYKDIRDRERIEGLVKEMEIANEKLRMLEGQKTEFVSIASHQLRTPLTVIKGYASMVLEGTFGTISDSVRDAMEKLYKSSERIVALVEDLLTVSRIEQGRMALSFEVVDLDIFMQGVLESENPAIEDAGLDLSSNIGGNEQFLSSIDEKKIKQVMKHVIDNAIKYTKAPGRIHVEISQDPITQKNRIAVSDTGVGMTTEQIHAVFERFNLKTDSSVKPDEHGDTFLQTNNEAGAEVQSEAESKMLEKRTPGIGLYIAQEIVHAHNGTLRIESAGLNRGTTMIIELPRVNDVETGEGGR